VAAGQRLGGHRPVRLERPCVALKEEEWNVRQFLIIAEETNDPSSRLQLRTTEPND
jgi:hypothetical protein